MHVNRDVKTLRNTPHKPLFFQDILRTNVYGQKFDYAVAATLIFITKSMENIYQILVNTDFCMHFLHIVDIKYFEECAILCSMPRH